MPRTTTEVLATRLDVLTVALQEVARALAPAQAAQVADGVIRRVAVLADRPLSPAADEAIIVQLAPLLGVLRVQSA